MSLRLNSTTFKVMLLLIVLVSMVACSGIQTQWDKLTPDQKARIVINDIQDQLQGLFTNGKAYVTANPQYQTVWNTKIVPAFNVANTNLASIIGLSKTSSITPEMVYSAVQQSVNSVILLLTQIGAIK